METMETKPPEEMTPLTQEEISTLDPRHSVWYLGDLSVHPPNLPQSPSFPLAMSAMSDLEDSLSPRTIYFDGTCTNNGAPSADAKAHVYIEGQGRTSYPVPEPHTNQRAELEALRRALEIAKDGDTIFGDSLYAINLAKGEFKAKENKDLVQQVLDLYNEKKVNLQHLNRDLNKADPNDFKEVK